MKISTLFLLIIGFTIFYSCNKELERPARDYPGVYTGTPQNITDTGFDIDLNIIGNLDDITEYGFIWSDRDNPAINRFGLMLTIPEQPQDNTVSTRIKWDLPIGSIFIRAFIKRGQQIIYGPVEKTRSLGGSPPEITQITPSSFAPGDTICIIGEGFATIRSQNTISIDGENIGIIENSSTVLKIIAPAVNTSNPSLVVSSWGRSVSSSTAISSSIPFISSLSEGQTGMDQLITIRGENFSINDNINSVTFKNDLLTKEGTIISSFKDSIIVRVPNLSINRVNPKYTVVVQVGNISVEKEDLFTFLLPTFLTNQNEADLCDTITVRGFNFSPIPENNSFITTTNDVPINIVSSSSTELKFIYQRDISYTNGGTNPNYIELNLNTNGHSNRTDIPIANAAITSPSSTVINNGDNDIIIEITGSGFSAFENHYNTSVTVPSNFTPSFQAQVVSADCNKVVFKIDQSRIGPEVTLDQTWMLNVAHPSGDINHDIILQIQGKRKPLKQAPTNIIDLFSSKRGFSYDSKGYYVGIGGSTYSYDPAIDTWEYVVANLDGMNFAEINNQTVGNLAIHTWNSNNEFQVAALDLNNNTWIEYDTPSDGIEPPMENYYDFSFDNKYYLVGVNTSEVWQFTPMTNTWVPQNLSPYPFGVSHNGNAFAIGNKVYLYDGNNIVIYDPIADSWDVGASNSTDLVFDDYTTTAINNKLYLISPNQSGQGTLFSEYDPATDAWTTLETLTDRAHQKWSFLFTIGDEGYMHQSEFTQKEVPYSLSDFWSYKPE